MANRRFWLMRKAGFVGHGIPFSSAIIDCSVYRALVVLSVLLGTINPSFAEVEEIVVTANRLPEPVGDVADSAIVLTAADIQTSPASTVDELLRELPGFSLFRRSGSLSSHPTTQGATLRGIAPSGASRALLLLDGVPLNDPFGGWVYWSRLPRQQLQRIEVVRGGGSGAWGSAALGGVIQLFQQSITPGVRTTTIGGLRGLFQEDIDAAERFGRHRVALSLLARNYSGHDLLNSAQRGAIDEPAESEAYQISARMSSSLESGDWNVSLGRFREERGNGTPLTNNETDNSWLSVGFERQLGNRGAWRAQLYAQDQEFSSQFSAQAADRQTERPALDQFSVPSQAYGLNLQRDFHFRAFGGDLQTAIGLDGRLLEGETAERFRFVGGGFQNRREAGAQQQFWGLYGSSQWQVANGRWQLVVSARVDDWQTQNLFRRETRQSDGQVLRNDRPADRQQFRFSPKLASRWLINEHWRLRSSVYGGFRAPTINELIRPFRVRNDITEANPALKPESLVGVELGTNFNGDWFLGAVSASATIFHNRLRNAIANVTLAEANASGVIAPCGFVPAGGSCRQRQNLRRVEAFGLEWDIELPLSRQWQFEVHGLIGQSRVRRADQRQQIEGKQLLQTPNWSASTALRYRWSAGHIFRLQSRFVGRQFEDDTNTRRLGSYALLDVFAEYQASRKTQIFLRVENLLDRDYAIGETADGLVTVGQPILASIGLTYQWK